MRVPGLPAAGGDRLRPRRQQRRDLPQRAGQGAGVSNCLCVNAVRESGWPATGRARERSDTDDDKQRRGC